MKMKREGSEVKCRACNLALEILLIVSEHSRAPSVISQHIFPSVLEEIIEFQLSTRLSVFDLVLGP